MVTMLIVKLHKAYHNTALLEERRFFLLSRLYGAIS